MLQRMVLIFAIWIAGLTAALAQPVTVIGPIIPGDCPQFSSTTIIKDSGFNCNGSPAVSFSNPTATAGPTANNGVATTAMRSDASPAVQKGTNSQFGLVEGDGTTIDCSVTPGICVAKVSISGTSTVAGASTTYTSAQGHTIVKRLNSGVPMSDLLPGTSPGVLPANTLITIQNADTAAILSVKAGAGATINSNVANTGFVYLCPGQAITFFSDGTNYQSTTAPLPCAFAADTTIFVSASGSNTNDGLTVSTPLADLQTAWNLAKDNFNANSKNLTLQLANGTYTIGASGWILSGRIPGQTAGDNTRAGADSDSSVRITGNTATPASVLLQGASNLGTLNVFNGARVSIRGVKITNSVGSYDLYVIQSWVSTQNMDFGAPAAGGVQLSLNTGAFAEIYTPYTISAGSGCHIIAASSSFAQWLGNGLSPGVITLTGTPAFASGFACTQQGGGLSVSIINTFSGTATGPRFNMSLDSTIDSGGQGVNYFPGNAVGVVTSNSVYAGLVNATLQANLTNPTGTTSATGVMMGLGSTCTITPVSTGRVKAEFIGGGQTTSATGRLNVNVKFGTGGAPANAAVPTGTTIGNLSQITTPGTANRASSFTNGGIITGLTLGTTYWFDLLVADVDTNTSTVLNLSCNAFEF